MEEWREYQQLVSLIPWLECPEGFQGMPAGCWNNLFNVRRNVGGEDIHDMLEMGAESKRSQQQSAPTELGMRLGRAEYLQLAFLLH